MDYVTFEGDAEVMINQITNPEEVAEWIIVEEIQFLRQQLEQNTTWGHSLDSDGCQFLGS